MDTFVPRHCFRARSIRLNVGCSSSSFPHLVEPLLGCRCHGVGGSTRRFYSPRAEERDVETSTLCDEVQHDSSANPTQRNDGKEKTTKKKRGSKSCKSKVEREINFAERSRDSRRERTIETAWSHFAYKRDCENRMHDCQDGRSSSTQEKGLRDLAQRRRNTCRRAYFKTSGRTQQSTCMH